MNSYAIIKLEADSLAVKEDILQQFNTYMQQTARVPSFVHDKEGYFRLSYSDELGLSSAGILELGRFLSSSGYKVAGIQSAVSSEGEDSTEIRFAKGEQQGSVVLSTLRIY